MAGGWPCGHQKDAGQGGDEHAGCPWPVKGSSLVHMDRHRAARVMLAESFGNIKELFLKPFEVRMNLAVETSGHPMEPLDPPDPVRQIEKLHPT
nr:hypothetical protein Ade03nite_60920 [Actinoplanes derwentensis]